MALRWVMAFVSSSVTLPFGITYVVTEAPQDYRSEINISVGSSTMENQAAAPTAKGQITDDTTVFFRNTRGVAIPTNVRRAASGFGLTVFGTGGLIALLEQSSVLTINHGSVSLTEA